MTMGLGNRVKMVNSMNRSVYEVDRRCEEWVPKNKVPSFKILFNYIRDNVGGHVKAIKYIPLSNGVVDRLYKGQLSKTSANKIMTSYREVKASNIKSPDA